MSWTYINKNDIPNYIIQYPVLESFWDGLVLLETKDAVFLPEHFYKNYPSDYLGSYEGKNKVDPITVNTKFVKKLRPLQEEAWNAVKTIYDKNGYCNGILKLFPGAGKTVLASYLTCALKFKTCIIVDNENLMKQWIQEYLEFTNLTVDDIGIIQQKLTVTNKPVTICMVQSLLSKIKHNFNKAFAEIDSARFGLVVWDEAHGTSSSENFAKSSLLFRTPNKIGLSATPFHIGLSEALMKNTIGDIIYETKEYELAPKYYFVYYNSGLQEKIGRKMFVIKDYIKKKAFYNSQILESTKYRQLICKYTTNMIKSGYKLMIICITKKQVQTISEELTNCGIENRRFYGDEREIDKVNDSVVVATYSFCGRGFNMPTLSALLLACPLSGKKSIIQVVGRILRSYDNKKQPVVIDLVDLGFPLFSLPEVKRKIGIIREEFNCSILEYKEL